MSASGEAGAAAAIITIFLAARTRPYCWIASSASRTGSAFHFA